jgi:hypothetical protein
MSLPCEASPGSSQQESPDAIVANWVWAQEVFPAWKAKDPACGCGQCGLMVRLKPRLLRLSPHMVICRQGDAWVWTTCISCPSRLRPYASVGPAPPSFLRGCWVVLMASGFRLLSFGGFLLLIEALLPSCGWFTCPTGRPPPAKMDMATTDALKVIKWISPLWGIQPVSAHLRFL